jgi:hypothetical protein
MKTQERDQVVVSLELKRKRRNTSGMTERELNAYKTGSAEAYANVFDALTLSVMLGLTLDESVKIVAAQYRNMLRTI